LLPCNLKVNSYGGETVSTGTSMLPGCVPRHNAGYPPPPPIIKSDKTDSNSQIPLAIIGCSSKLLITYSASAESPSRVPAPIQLGCQL